MISRPPDMVWVEPEAITTLSQFCDGDARSALNSLQLAVQAKRSWHKGNTEQQNLSDSIASAKQISGTYMLINFDFAFIPFSLLCMVAIVTSQYSSINT